MVHPMTLMLLFCFLCEGRKGLEYRTPLYLLSVDGMSHHSRYYLFVPHDTVVPTLTPVHPPFSHFWMISSTTRTTTLFVWFVPLRLPLLFSSVSPIVHASRTPFSFVPKTLYVDRVRPSSLHIHYSLDLSTSLPPSSSPSHSPLITYSFLILSR